MKVRIIDNVVVVISELTKDMVNKLVKHAPEALAIFDEEENEIFKVAMDKVGGISKYGIAFDSETKSGKLCLTFKEKLTAEEVADKYAVALVNLKDVEENALNAYSSVSADLLEIVESIEVVDIEVGNELSADTATEEVE